MTPLLRTTALTFLAVMALYEGALRLAAPAVDQGEDIGTTNAIRLENYTDRATDPDTVIVGSSLGGRMQVRMIPRDWSNIAISGGSPRTGLAVVAAGPRHPKRVLIEINNLDRGGDPATVHQLLGWPQPLLRRIFWFYRSGYMPINLVFSEVESALNRRRAAHGGDAETPPANFPDLLALQQASYAKPPDTAHMADVAGLVRQLRAQGIQVGFFEMPVDRSLVNSPRLTALRRSVKAMFAPKEYCWLSIDQGDAWHTGDGEHLLLQDAAIAARRLAAARCGAAPH